MLQRQVRPSAACLGLAVLALAVSVSVFWRRARRGLGVLALAALLLAPWPQSNLLLTSATPTSFHASQGGFTAESIVRGQRISARQRADPAHGCRTGAPAARRISALGPAPVKNREALLLHADGACRGRVFYSYGNAAKMNKNYFTNELKMEWVGSNCHKAHVTFNPGFNDGSEMKIIENTKCNMSDIIKHA